MIKTLLIVDGNALDRTVVQGFLHEDYNIIEATDGREMLSVLRQRGRTISAILLDLSMPKTDGYEALQTIQENALYRQLPVIVASSKCDEKTQARALSLGAAGFASKPYKKDILLHLLNNIISLREKSAFHNSFSVDPLTGLFTRAAFCLQAAERIKVHEAGYYMLSCLDIESFKVVNDQYGIDVGDMILRKIAKSISEAVVPLSGICCHDAADRFAVLYPAARVDSEEIQQLHETIKSGIAENNNFKFRVGRYLVNDLTLSVHAMYDRANIAEESIKGRYDTYIAQYAEEMRQSLVNEQRVVNDMGRALAAGEFEPWFQPQYNHSTGALIGAEALVRWRKNGTIVSPKDFVPIFERNGFIYEVDCFIWRSVCILLRRWLDEGKDPLPVSVNISRFDLLQNDFLERICALTEEYDLPLDLLRLEVTESAFSETTSTIYSVVNELIHQGFTVEIDDFGSGYSSLNTLKDVPASILKLDMRFFEKTGDAKRGGNIVESVVRMAKWLDMVIIAEGVEEKAQADYLQSIGCLYIQGYLYAKPMPADEYEQQMDASVKGAQLARLQTMLNLDNNEFWDSRSMDSLIFNSYVGAACIFELSQGKVEMLRATKQLARMLWGDTFSIKDILAIDWSASMDKQNIALFTDLVRESLNAKENVTGEIEFHGLPGCPETVILRCNLRVIATSGERNLIYCLNENITEQREAEIKERNTAIQIQTIMANIQGGISATLFHNKNSIEFVFANDGFYALYGYTREQMTAEMPNVLDLILPEDRKKTMDTVARLAKNGGSETYVYRCYKRDGSIMWTKCTNSVISIEGVGDTVLLGISTDITKERELIKAIERGRQMVQQLMDDTPGGFLHMRMGPDNARTIINFNEGFCRMLNMSGDELMAEYGDDAHKCILPEDLARAKSITTKALDSDGLYTYKCRLKKKDGTILWTQVFGRYVKEENGELFCNTYFTDISEQISAEQQQGDLLDNLPFGAALYEFDGERLKALHINQQYRVMVGRSRNSANLEGYSPTDFIHPQDRDLALLAIKDAIAKQQDAKCNIRLVYGEDEYRFFHLDARVKEQPDGKYLVYVAYTPLSEQELTPESALPYGCSPIMESSTDLSFAKDFNYRPNKRGAYRYNSADETLEISEEEAKRLSLPKLITDVPYGHVKLGLVSPDTAGAYIAFFEAIRRGENSSVVFRGHLPAGWRWISAHASTVEKTQGQETSAIIAFEDVTEQQEKEAVFLKWQQNMQERKEGTYTLYQTNLNKNSFIYSTTGTLLDYSPKEGDVTSLTEWSRVFAEKHVVEEDREQFLTLMNTDILLDNFRRGTYVLTLDFRAELNNDAFRWLRLTVEMIKYPNSTGIELYLLFEDINERKTEELRTRAEAEADPLTGLLNRKAFTARVNSLIRNSNDGAQHAFFMLDIDGFKALNDTFGHAAGDEVLVEVAQKLQSILRSSDLIARFGGDEFVLFLSNISDEAVIERKAKQICKDLIKVYSAEIRLSVSVGITLCPRDGADCRELYERADTALYAAKENGRNTFVFYSGTVPHKRVGADTHEMNTFDTTASTVSQSKKKRMLVVNDDSKDCKHLKKLFEKDFFIDVATDGQTALSRMRYYGSALAVVLLGLNMNDMSGFDVLEKAMSCPEMYGVPIIVISDEDDKETCVRAIRLGATDFITKPVQTDLINLRIDAAISRADNERLRAQNSLLQMRGDEVSRYQTALNGLGMFVVEMDWIKGSFAYDPTTSHYLKGDYDDRTLWHILLTDMVADTQNVRMLQEFIHKLADDHDRSSGMLEVELKTPSNKKHTFRVSAEKVLNARGLTQKLIITFKDLDGQ